MIFVPFNQINKPNEKCVITAHIPKLLFKKIYFFSSLYIRYIRMSGRSINVGNKKIEKNGSYKKKNEKIFNTDDVDVNEILVSKKETYSKNNSLIYFIGYNDNVIRPLCLRLTQMTDYINKVNNKNKNNNNENTITMSLRVKDKKLLKTYNKIWKKIERLISIDLDSKPVYGNDDKYIKTKIKT